MASPDRPVASAPSSATLSRDRHRGFPRAVRYGLLISIALHLILLLIYPSFVGIPSGTILPPSDEASPPPPEGLRLLALRELPPGIDAAEPRPELPVTEVRDEDEEMERADPFLPPPAVEPSAPGGVGGGTPAEQEEREEARRRSAAELLRPGTLDPALFGDLELPPLSDEERYRLQLAGRLEAWQDSVRTEMERAARATDWSYTDEEGNRWGVSPGRIHLGKFSLPLPFAFSTPPGLRDEIQRRGWESSEIRRGAIEGEIFETQQERIREIRARREAERRDTLPPGGGR